MASEPTDTEGAGDDRAADRSGIQVIARAAAIMNVLAEEPGGLGLSDIAARVNLARSTVQRIVGALVDERFLIHAGRRIGFKLGPALARMAGAAHRDVADLVRPIMQELSDATGETVDLSLLRGNSAVFIEQIMGMQRLVAVSAVGTSFPLHCTANGKAILAIRAPARRAELLPAILERFTARTIVDREVLETELEQVKASGVAWDLEEHSEGLCALGFGFEDLFGRAYALSIPVPAARFEQNRQALVESIAGVEERIRQVVES